MVFFDRKRRGQAVAEPARAGLYGKHPSAGDFVRSDGSSQLIREFDKWLSGALVRAGHERDDWDALYAAGAQLSFVWMPDHQAVPRLLLGAMCPSTVQSGRQFPLVVFADVDAALVIDYALLPYHPFLGQAHRLLTQRARYSPKELSSAAVGLASQLDSSAMLGANKQRERYWAAVDAPAALGEMFGPSLWMQAAHAINAVDELGQAATSTTPRYGLRCPLGQHPQDHAAFWLSRLQRGAPHQRVPCLLWSGEVLLMSFGKLPAEAILATWDPSFNNDAVSDLVELARSSGGAPPFSISGSLSDLL